MYLISIYFDEETNKRMECMIKNVARRCGNVFMVDNNVPPHITLSALECDRKTLDIVIKRLDEVMNNCSKGELFFPTVGQFMPGVLYAAPVLNRYLQNLSEEIYNVADSIENVKVSRYYRPFQWFPHMTIAKTLSREEMKAAFEYIQETWGTFSAKVIKIGLAKTNPYENIKLWQLS